jgi:hypothetical protein
MYCSTYAVPAVRAMASDEASTLLVLRADCMLLWHYADLIAAAAAAVTAAHCVRLLL